MTQMLELFALACLPAFLLLDMIFGTFKNPETFDGEAGFYTGGSDRVLEMLTGRDVSRDEPAREAPATGQRTAA
ncbi:MAG TPA: hypothetical protein VLB51_06755 [Methylomirabilota bacterium]|nr:hypothetical protein [Methylomirabilota bacterium]